MGFWELVFAAWLLVGGTVVVVWEWILSRPRTAMDDELSRVDAEIDAARRRHPSRGA